MLMAMDNTQKNQNQTVAAFLITRPPYAYLGWGWESDDRNWNDLFWLQVGEPLNDNLCMETQEGIFSRIYTLGTVSLNCNTWTAILPFASLVLY